jgi:hypothetical protein
MDNPRLLERIESGELKIEDDFDGVQLTVEVEAVDQLGLLLKRIVMETRSVGQRPGVLQNQARAIVEKLTYLGGALKVVEVDGVSNAAQIRSATPEKDGFVEVLLRGGNWLSLERRPDGALHLSKGNFGRLVDDLAGIL